MYRADCWISNAQMRILCRTIFFHTHTRMAIMRNTSIMESNNIFPIHLLPSSPSLDVILPNRPLYWWFKLYWKKFLTMDIDTCINDSTHQSFVMANQFRIKLQYKIIRNPRRFDVPIEYCSTIWGQTCNSQDKIIDSHVMPELEIDDYIVFENMGAYTTTASSHFNGFQIGKIVCIH